MLPIEMYTFSSLFRTFSHTHKKIYFQNFKLLNTVVEIQAAGGIVSTDDIKAYVPITHVPLQMPFMGHTYVGESVR